MAFVFLALGLFLLDTCIKHYVEKNLKKETRVPFFKGRVFLTKYHNKGAALGIGEKNPRLICLLSAILSAVGIVIYVLTLKRHGDALLKTGISLMIGAGVSNSSDRLTRGYVVDYIGFPKRKKTIKKKHIIYNLSDFFLFLGSALCLIWAILAEE